MGILLLRTAISPNDMLPVAIIILLAVSTVAASALAHDEKRWRYPAIIALGCAVYLAAWGAGMLRKFLKLLSVDLHPMAAAVAVAVPLGFFLFSLVARRNTIPRHTPGVEDDPVLRRYLEEKARRARKRRQEDAAAEDADLPVL
jgi:hypothetical protein